MSSGDESSDARARDVAAALDEQARSAGAYPDDTLLGTLAAYTDELARVPRRVGLRLLERHRARSAVSTKGACSLN